MTCPFKIATRAGLHLSCILPDGHDGDCLPQLPEPCTSVPRAFHWAAAREPEFLGHLLEIVETAGKTLTYLQALNFARALCRARLGIPERRT